MRQSTLFTTSRREAPKDEESVNAQLLMRAGFIHKEMAGVYSFLPLGLRVLRKIEQVIREEMLLAQGQEILMPSLHPKEPWVQTGRWESFDALFRLKSASLSEYALGPTHEEIIVPLMKQFVFSWRDLPVAVFQFQNKFRDEKRAKSGLLRGREFLMKDLYSFHSTEEDMENYYAVMRDSYTKIFQRVGLGEQTYFTYASGGTFAKYSHEFQTIAPDGEDTIYACPNCKVAVNEEIREEQQACPSCGNGELRKESAIEVGNIFKLKTKYSDAFSFAYKDEKGEPHPVLMGCFGIGVSRLMGAIAEIHHDEKGIIWPETVAPYSVHLLSLSGGEEEAEKLYERLEDQGIDVLYDDRDKSPGEKLMDADLLGIPLRIVVSERTLKEQGAEVKKRDENQSRILELHDILAYAIKSA